MVKNGIFQEFPKMAKIGYFPKNVVFQEMGYFRIFASVGEKWENGCFCVFWKNGGSVEKVILTDLVKNVKNGVFLTKCQKDGNVGFDRSATVLYRVKKSRSAVFGHIWFYR